jgi:hypothetical protein
MESKRGTKISVLAPTQIRLESPQLEGEVRFQVIQIHFERGSAFPENAGPVAGKSGQSARIRFEEGPVPVFLETSASQRGIEEHVMAEVSSHIPPEPDPAIEVGRVRMFRCHSLAKDAVRIVTQQIPRQVARVANIHLISLERNAVIRRVSQRPCPCFAREGRRSSLSVIVNAPRRRRAIAHRSAPGAEEKQ